MRLLIIIVGLYLCACSQQAPEQPDPRVLIDVDKEFSAMSKKQGMSKAFIYYAADEAVKLGQGSHPLIGKTSLSEAFSKIDNDKVSLTWEPAKADIAQSGGPGYTYGKYWFTVQDSVESTETGYYFSVWKKQANGSRKYVLDGGAERPVE